MFRSIFDGFSACFRPLQEDNDEEHSEAFTNYIDEPTTNLNQNLAFTNYIDALPCELICELMSFMTLRDRKNFVDAYPRYQSLALSPVLGTRVITGRDTVLTTNDMSRVLDLDGTEIKIQGLFLNSVLYLKNVFWIFEVLQLMPKLEKVVLKDCWLSTGLLLKQEHMFSASESLKLLSDRVKHLTIDNCSLSGFFASRDREHWKKLFKGYFPPIWQSSSLPEVVLKDTLPFSDFGRLMNLICEEDKLNINLEVEGLRGDTYREEIYDTPDVEDDDYEPFSPQQYLDALAKALKKERRYKRTKCHKLQISRGSCGTMIVNLKDDFDMELFEKEFNG